MPSVTIELSERGCDRALKQIEQYERRIRPKLDEVCKRLAEIGAAMAQRIFDDPSVIAEGNGGTAVTVEKIENGYSIVASGEAVYFVEFGTGNQATSNHGFTVSVPISPGSWSEGHAQKFSEYGFWWYNKVKYTETPTYAPMFYASKEIRANAKRVAEEVFGR